MFERFTKQARALVIDTQEQARRMGHGAIGTQHLLLALLAQDERPAALLRNAGVTYAQIETAVRRYLGEPEPALGPEDTEALRAIGIDLDEVRARIEEDFGPSALTPQPPPPPRRRFGLGRRNHEFDPPRPAGDRHIPFTPRAKKVLELSLREAIRLGHRHIGTELILLGLLRESEGLAAKVLADARVDVPALRRQIEASLREAA